MATVRDGGLATSRGRTDCVLVRLLKADVCRGRWCARRPSAAPRWSSRINPQAQDCLGIGVFVPGPRRSKKLVQSSIVWGLIDMDIQVKTRGHNNLKQLLKRLDQQHEALAQALERQGSKEVAELQAALLETAKKIDAVQSKRPS